MIMLEAIGAAVFAITLAFGVRGVVAYLNRSATPTITEKVNESTDTVQ